MTYIFSAVLSLAWIAICLLLLLMPSDLDIQAVVGLLLIILHKDAGRNLKSKENASGEDLVYAATAVFVVLMSLGFILRALLIQYGAI